ncbi:HDOD domain-containing protein [Desulfosarcina widdelii]|nr:HDOD domain-containing protein [Desulfosarcina widdelii]
MVLDESVYDINSRLLLSKGQKISQNHVRVLKIWGVSRVSVIGKEKEEDEETPSVDDKNTKLIKESINVLYKNADLTNPIFKQIYISALVHRLKGTFGSLPEQTPKNRMGGTDLKKPEKIRRQIDVTDIKLPEAPTVISELNQVIDDPLTTSNDVAQVVNKSPSLAAMLLKIVNSAYYGFPSKIDRISRAVTIIGTKEISGLALGICVMQAFKDIPEGVLNIKAFMRHSLVCGMISRILAANNNMPQTEQMFVSGLLHDIGKLIVHKYYPNHAKACMELGASSDRSIFQTEKMVLGLNHQQIAKLLLSKWKLPNEIITNIIYHHEPGKAPDPKKSGIIHIADIISHGLGIGSSGERSIPKVDHPLVDEIVNSRDSIKLVIRQIVHQFGPMDAIFSD